VSENHIFDFSLDLTQHPSKYKDAAITNLFYMNNIMHDLFYNYGFTEEAGNFQESNMGKGGLGGDSVIANAQDPSGTNNANFYTPPDGQRPRMRMYIWTRTDPPRDSDFANDVIAHEYGHGISNRLTGGPANSDCLGSGQAGGMGEGWSDFFAVWLQMKATDTRNKIMLMGEYVYGEGIRNYPYSTDMKVNPTTFSYVGKPDWTGVHPIGSVWAEILYEYYWNLVDKLGFTEDIYSADITKGNTLALKLVVDALKLQPCKPNFLTARDAILQAEEQVTGGQHKCEIWKAFAKRGVGVDAKIDGLLGIDGFGVPEECQ
jgi:extracellular elastinolytic metalloproteinase